MRNVEAQLEKLTVDPGSSPDRVGERHLADEFPEFTADRRASWSPVPRFPGPEEAEPPAVPADNGLRAKETERITPSRPPAGEPDPEETVHRSEPRPLGTMPKERQLLAQRKVFKGEIPARPQGG